MNILMIILLTVLMLSNIILITTVALTIRGCKDKNSRMGCIIMLLILIADTVAVLGGVVL